MEVACSWWILLSQPVYQVTNHHLEESEYSKVIFGRWKSPTQLLQTKLVSSPSVCVCVWEGEARKYVCLSGFVFPSSACPPVSLCAWLFNLWAASSSFSAVAPKLSEEICKYLWNQIIRYPVNIFRTLQKASDDCLLFLSVSFSWCPTVK